jgi:ubiquinone/menaquinone biosynthesis C-methylase UbiE
MAKTTWNGFKGKFWGFVFRSRIMRYLFGFYIFSNKHARQIKKTIKEKLKNGGYCVDLGAGSGFYTLMAAKVHAHAKIAAVDQSEVMLKQLKDLIHKNKLENRVEIYQENVENTSIASGVADLIIASNLLHELKTPDKFIGEMFRILKTDGTIVASEFVDNKFGKKFLSHHKEEVYGPYKLEDLKKYFLNQGFKNINIGQDNNRLLAIVKK